jgi:DNA-binding response OmpR family regulator
VSKSGIDARVLIVNHHRDSNELMEVLLWMNGYDAESAETLTTANGLLRDHHYALLICRNAMTDGCGNELIEHAWKHFRMPGVLLTGSPTKQQMAARVTHDALHGVLVIPYAAEELLSTVRAICGTVQGNDGDATTRDRRCPDCRGVGTISLLIHRTSCRRCGGSGRIACDVLDLSLRKVNLLSPRTRFALHRSGIRTLRQAARLTDAELQNVPGISATAIEVLKGSLRQLLPACR